MGITQQELDQAYTDFKGKYAGRKEDYFAGLFLAHEFNRKFEEVAHQVAFGGNDYGLDAYFIDRERRNLYLFQFKWSENHGLFKDSFKRLIEAGMERVFGNPLQDPKQNEYLLQLKAELDENQAIIDRVLIHFVFNGDPAAAEESMVLDSLREDLEAKMHLIEAYFGRPVGLTFQFICNRTSRRKPLAHTKKTHRYEISLTDHVASRTPGGETMHVGFLRLADLHRMYLDMGPRFFERNIRAGLSPDKPPNRAIRQALKRIVIDKAEAPEVFVFNHNGVTISAEHLDIKDGHAVITEPRLLNGAQTVTSVAKFMEDNKGNQALSRNETTLEAVQVFAKVITKASAPFVTQVTICNNRQNRVEPWMLRANDLIQLALQDKFRDELGIYYERQEGAFEGLSNEDLEQMGIEQFRAIELKRLAQTLLVAQGEIDKISKLRLVFENENQYNNTFKESYLRADARRILLAYKIQFRINRILQELVERGARKYAYVWYARNLVWALLIQAAFNDDRLEDLAERYGNRLVNEADYTEYLKDLASRRVRFLIADAVKAGKHERDIEEENYSFLRSKAFYTRCMDAAYRRWKWTRQSL